MNTARAKTRIVNTPPPRLVSLLITLFLEVLPSLIPTSIQSHVCTATRCTRPLARCIREPECRAMLDCLAECSDENSAGRRNSVAKYQHMQFPQDKALCEFECLELMTTEASEEIIECISTENCMPPAVYSDTCADFSQEHVVPFSNISSSLEGRWNKLFVNGWDIWPCQATHFFPPGATSPNPKSWMQYWPNDPNVWRMDFHWSFSSDHGRVFSMSNEMHPDQQWNLSQSVNVYPTLSALAVMWGTTAHENWYVLYADENIMLIHVCAYTLQVQSYDALTIVFAREGVTVTDEMANEIQATALDILGPKSGMLIRVPSEDCPIQLPLA